MFFPVFPLGYLVIACPEKRICFLKRFLLNLSDLRDLSCPPVTFSFILFSKFAEFLLDFVSLSFYYTAIKKL